MGGGRALCSGVQLAAPPPQGTDGRGGPAQASRGVLKPLPGGPTPLCRGAHSAPLGGQVRKGPESVLQGTERLPGWGRRPRSGRRAGNGDGRLRILPASHRTRQVCGERPRPTPHALWRRTRPPLTRTSEPVSATLSAPPLPSAEGSLSQQPHGVGALGPAAGCERRAAAVRVPVWQLSPAGMGATLRICLPRWRRPRPGLGLGGRGGRQVDRGEVPTPSQGSGPEVHL